MNLHLNKNICRLLFISAFVNATAFGQSLNLSLVSALPANFKEGSGLIYTGAGHLITHNDGGSPTEIAILDTIGSLLKTVFIANAQNIDWEDITRDDSDNYYLGDFGNNLNDRTDLAIYKIPNPEVAANDTVIAQSITFTYSNQTMFPPAAANLHFDCEALVWFNDSLFLFSKNRSSPFNGYTYMYAIPALPGNYVATLVDSFYCGPGPKEDYWITAAAFNMARTRLVLLSSARVWLFENYNGSQFFNGTNLMLSLSSFSQKEGITFDNGTQLYICDEQTLGFFGNIYKTDLNSILSSVQNPFDNSPAISLIVNNYFLRIDNIPAEIDQVMLFNTMGEIITQRKVNDTFLEIELLGFAGGAYFISFSSSRHTYSRHFFYKGSSY